MSHFSEPPPDFSTSGHLAADREAGDNPLLHAPQHGPPGAPSTPDPQFATDYELASGKDGVDQAWYLHTNPDVGAAGVDPVAHYLEWGWREGRDPRPDFSTSGYLEANKEAEGNPLLHYLRQGPSGAPPPPQSQFVADYELASGDRGVDRAWYLRTYPDVEAAGMDPVAHYLRWGWREGRDPCPDFSTSGYLEANKEARGNPLLHYLRSTREVHLGERPVTDWYLLWKRRLLHPKGGQEILPHAAFGSPGLPRACYALWRSEKSEPSMREIAASQW